MEEQPLTKESNHEIEQVQKINPKSLLRKRDDFEKMSPQERKMKRAVLSANMPSYCLKEGVGSLECVGESLRSQHRKRLSRLLDDLIRQHNWAEASGVLSVLLQATLKDTSSTRNRAKYSVALELLNHIKGETISSRKIQNVYDLWMKKLGSLRNSATKDRFAVQVEFVLLCLQRGILDVARRAAESLVQEPGFDSDPIANLVVGLAYCELWYSDLPNQWTELNLSSGTNKNNARVANSALQCGWSSSTSVANDKVLGDDSNQQNALMEIDDNTKKETCHTSLRPPEFDNGNSNLSYLPHASIFYTQGLPVWLFPMKLPSSHEKLEDAMSEHRSLLNDDHKSALKHLRVALYSRPPIVEAFHPLIQMLLLGDHVQEAFDELEALLDYSSDTLLTLRMKASLLEHFDSHNHLKLCKCYEDILNKDPTCSDSLAKLVHMHKRGEYGTQDLVELIASHLDACTHAPCDTWHELASCFLELSNKIPDLLINGESGKSWRLRSKWWSSRHFHKSIMMSDAISGDLKLLTYKAEAASHIYGPHFDYVKKAIECIEKANDIELHSLLQIHIRNSVLGQQHK